MMESTLSDACQVWAVVGGGNKGGIMVRQGRELNSLQYPERLSKAALVKEVELVADRLRFERLTGSGPNFGWVSTSLKGKVLMVKTDRMPSEEEMAAHSQELSVSDEAQAAVHQASDAIAPDASWESGNEALSAMAKAWSCKGARPQLCLARGTLLWRWDLLGKALFHLKEAETQSAEGAQLAALSLCLCLSQWAEARRRATEVGHKLVLASIDNWEAAAESMSLFTPPFPAAKMVKEPKEVVAGIMQTDAFVKVPHAQLGVRFLLHHDQGGRLDVQRPLLLIFHGEDEDVDAYLPDKFALLESIGASALVVGYRGFGFSRGSPSQATLHTDADCVCELLPQLFKEQGYPWPWPGHLTLFGSALGSRVACYLACTHAQLFTGGVVLETGWCGSYAPNAKPPPEPEEGGRNKLKFKNRVWNEALAEEAQQITKWSRHLARKAGLQHVDSYCYVKGSEDLLRGFNGNLLILHGEQNMVISVEHAKRLCDAAVSADRKLVIIKHVDDETMRNDQEYTFALRTFLSSQQSR